jgi:hypothetical protein
MPIRERCTKADPALGMGSTLVSAAAARLSLATTPRPAPATKRPGGRLIVLW